MDASARPVRAARSATVHGPRRAKCPRTAKTRASSSSAVAANAGGHTYVRLDPGAGEQRRHARSLLRSEPERARRA